MNNIIETDNIAYDLRDLKNRVDIIEQSKRTRYKITIKNIEDWGSPVGGYVTLKADTEYIYDALVMQVSFGFILPANGGNIKITGTLGGSKQQIVCVNPSVTLFTGGSNTYFIADSIGFGHVAGGKIFDLNGGFNPISNPNGTGNILFNVVTLFSNGTGQVGNVQNYVTLLFSRGNVVGLTDGFKMGGFFGGFQFEYLLPRNNGANFRLIEWLTGYYQLFFSIIRQCQIDTGAGANQYVFYLNSGVTLPIGGITISDNSIIGASTHFLFGFTPSVNTFRMTNNPQPPLNTQFGDSIESIWISLTTPSTTPILAINTWYSLQGTTVANISERFTMSSNGEVQYTGARPITARINFEGALYCASNGGDISIGFFKNGTLISYARIGAFAKFANEKIQISLVSPSVPLIQNDKVKIYVLNGANTGSITWVEGGYNLTS